MTATGTFRKKNYKVWPKIIVLEIRLIWTKSKQWQVQIAAKNLMRKIMELAYQQQFNRKSISSRPK